jgi:hypothetical protein
MTNARPLDHLVVPVTDLRTARSRLTRLGFTVAADARHPFGTENACVFLADKSYLEPLAVGDLQVVETATRAGNQFVARDAAYRFRNGVEGLSAIVLATQDADADHAAFRDAGLSTGDQLEFSRVMKFPDGSEMEASFKLSFAADLRAPDFFAFTCERINMPPADRSALERHENGATGILKVILSETEPAAFAAYLQAVTLGEVSAADHRHVQIATANTVIEVVDPATLQGEYGVPRSADRGLRGEAIIFRVADLATTERLFAANGVRHVRSGGMVIVPREPGQGTLFVFSE